MNPKTDDDFAALFNELDVWRKNEVIKIKSSTASGEERTKALNDLLFNETQALQSIRKLKATAKKDVQSEKTLKMLQVPII